MLTIAGGADAADGVNSWNFFAAKVTDKDIRASADQIVSTGMRTRATFT